MQLELVRRLNRGEMPDRLYRIANTEEELIKIIETLKRSRIIPKDLPARGRFSFAKTRRNRWIFACGTRQTVYDDVPTGVRDFRVGRQSLINFVRGRRFGVCTCYAPVMDPIDVKKQIEKEREHERVFGKEKPVRYERKKEPERTQKATTVPKEVLERRQLWRENFRREYLLKDSGRQKPNASSQRPCGPESSRRP